MVPWMSGLVSGLQNRVRRFESARYLPSCKTSPVISSRAIFFYPPRPSEDWVSVTLALVRLFTVYIGNGTVRCTGLHHIGSNDGGTPCIRYRTRDLFCILLGNLDCRRSRRRERESHPRQQRQTHIQGCPSQDCSTPHSILHFVESHNVTIYKVIKVHWPTGR